jgi:hypothetical protein
LPLGVATEGFSLVDGQIQYGSAGRLTSVATPGRRRFARQADPHRFELEPSTSRSVVLVVGVSLLLGAWLAAMSREIPGIVVAIVLGGAWLSLVLAMTLPTRSERAGAELARRLGLFRHELNLVGDHPTRANLEALIARAGELELRDEEIASELKQIRASLEALDIASEIGRAALPVVASAEPLAPGDVCHFVTPVRFGRRRSDQFGHLSLTSGWMKFRGALDVSIAWSEVADVQRSGPDLIVTLHDSTRMLRFSCHSESEAARAGVLAQHLATGARTRDAGSPHAGYHAAL